MPSDPHPSRFWLLVGLLLLGAALALLFHPLPPDRATPPPPDPLAPPAAPRSTSAPPAVARAVDTTRPAPAATQPADDPFLAERQAFAPELMPVGDAGGPQTLHLAAYLIDTSRSNPAGQSTREALPAWPDASAVYFVQLAGPVQEDWKRGLVEAGARLYDFVPNHAFLLRADGAVLRRIAALPYVTWIGPYRSDYRVQPFLRHLASVWPDAHAPVQVTLRAFEPEDLDGIAEAIVRSAGRVLDRSTRRPQLRAELPLGAIAPLAEAEGLQWLEEYVAPKPFNLSPAVERPNLPQAQAALGLKYSGCCT